MMVNKTKVILLDIEGTTTSISFVHDVLFPYAKQNVEAFLQESWEKAEIKQIVLELQQLPQFKEYTATPATSINVQVIASFVHYLIDKDLKVTPLKTLQGLIWAKGYESGELKGHVYEDVAQALKDWQAKGLRIAIYSSGSVNAQKLIFGYSINGNLLPYISEHFDTQVGHKQQKESYVNIAKALQEDPQDILFLTDVPGEAAAAVSAGLQAQILRRPGNAPLLAEHLETYPIISDFNCLELN